MSIGTEHEYSINDAHFRAQPVSDRVIRSICGSFESEILFGDVKLGKELQKHVLEFIPRSHADTIPALESQLMQGIHKFYRVFPHEYHLLGLGMHPTLTLDNTAVWNHDEGEYYAVYDRLFDIHQHGWLNIQALQINLSYTGDKDMVAMYNRLRPLLPYLIAVTASSPMVEGRLTGAMDNRLIYYRENQRVIPAICHGIIPAPIRNVDEYRKGQELIYAELRHRDAEILCEEWLNSSGVIVRFSRKCLEIKALDEQECIRSDMAVCAFVQALLRCRALSLETDQDALLALTESVIMQGTATVREDLNRLYEAAWGKATPEERQYLPVIQNRIAQGSLAEQIARRYREEQDIIPILSDLAHCLRYNKPYG